MSKKRITAIRDIYEKPHSHFDKDDPVTGFLEEHKFSFLGRFKFKDDIQLVEEDLMKNFYCSIIIPAQYKKRILKELEHFGITKSFIFPEVEYTAKEIRNKFFYDK